MSKQRLCVHCIACEREEPAILSVSYPSDEHGGRTIREDVCADHAEIIMDDYPDARERKLG